MINKTLEKEVKIKLADVSLEGSLGLPSGAEGVVLFSHGSGSSRHSPRNNFVADLLRQSGIGTLLFDLLTEEEDARYDTRFNIPLLTRRLIRATRWLIEDQKPKRFSIGYFGASTGAAAALEAAAKLPADVCAVVSRGGRPDLAMETLPFVKAPTLLIVGGNDFQVIDLNRLAYDQLTGKKEMAIIPGATHLFEEPGTLERAAELAVGWFTLHLTQSR
ncbi:MAG: dienelactone hydrolase family protein [Nitrospirae bacterium]|nr:dienelactone hydrolase family protein [Nitrospirota bacterium]